jgi:acyl carrier protein
MCETTETSAKIRLFIMNNFYIPPEMDLTDQVSLVRRRIIDSTGVLELIGFLEEEFNIQVANEEALPENLDSIENIAAFIQRKQPPAQ